MAFGRDFKKIIHVEHPGRRDRDSVSLCGEMGVSTTSPDLFKLSGNKNWKPCQHCSQKLLRREMRNQ